MMIIKTEATETGLHLFQSQSHRQECWLDGYIAVPKELEKEVMDCNGYCDLTIEDGVLKGITAKPDLIPTVEKSTKPTELEQLRADIDYISIMTGVEL